jgi:hypothetical protein
MTDVGPGRAPDADDEDSLDGALGELTAALRAPVDFGDGVDLAVMAAVRLAPPLTVVPGGAGRQTVARPPMARPGVVTRGARWLARPRPMRVSPLGALMAAGLAFAAVFGLRREATRSEGALARTGEFPTATGEFPAVSAAGAARTRDTVFVTRFVLAAPSAKQVALVGDFNDWDRKATPLIQAGGNGLWTVELPLGAGRYNYAFLVDGHRWTADPAAPPAPRAVADDFGQPNSVVTVRGA